MAITYTDFVNGDTLLTIREKLNTFNNSVVGETATLASDILSNTGGINVNTANIATNTADISTNAYNISLNNSSITDNTNRLVELENFTLYTFNTVNDVTIVDSTYEQVNQVSLTELAGGTYEVKLSQVYSLDSSTTSAFFRFSLDGGGTWVEIRREPKDNTDNLDMTMFVPINVADGGTLNVIIEARKEVTGDVLFISSNSIVVERKL